MAGGVILMWLIPISRDEGLCRLQRLLIDPLEVAEGALLCTKTCGECLWSVMGVGTHLLTLDCT